MGPYGLDFGEIRDGHNSSVEVCLELAHRGHDGIASAVGLVGKLEVDRRRRHAEHSGPVGRIWYFPVVVHDLRIGVALPAVVRLVEHQDADVCQRQEPFPHSLHADSRSEHEDSVLPAVLVEWARVVVVGEIVKKYWFGCARNFIPPALLGPWFYFPSTCKLADAYADVSTKDCSLLCNQDGGGHDAHDNL